jgi:hypothetical protein
MDKQAIGSAPELSVMSYSLQSPAKLLTFMCAAWVGCVAAENKHPSTNPRPLVHAHAHNDYEHTRPLFDALDHGFCSVEADIYLVDGKLLVAHQRSRTSPDRTLQSLYLDPLRERIRKNNGRVYPNGPECTLLIDLKTDWQTIYPVLRKVLGDYSDILSSVENGKRHTRALTAIITGSRSLDMFKGEAISWAAYDGELTDLDSDHPPAVIPWISHNWAATFRWRGTGEMPAEDAHKLQSIVEKAHAKGRKLRFWGAPDKPVFWKAMLDTGVDIINSDDLAGLQQFMNGCEKP